jgi:murein L,D-transpeptidase YafK
MQENRPLTNFGSRFTVLGLLCMAMISGAIMEPSPFRTQQKKFSRVKQAYLNCEKTVKQLFDTAGIDYTRFHLALVASKEDKQLKVFAANRATDAFTHITTYDFCVLSGSLGPKRKEGDLQVPEGLYHISKFNPVSNFHLSLKVNYPNASDRILSDRQQPGGEIYIHGNCVSVGCIPVTDEKI